MSVTTAHIRHLFAVIILALAPIVMGFYVVNGNAGAKVEMPPAGIVASR